jgi:hypothetical protein
MRTAQRLSCVIAVTFAAACLPAAADIRAGAAYVLVPGEPVQVTSAKATSTQTLGSRATVNANATAFGGFEIRSTANVYVLVRGNSLGTLGVTQGFLDYPRVRLYNAAGADLVTDGTGRVGFNSCLSALPLQEPVVSFYANVRHQAVHDHDSCVALNMPAGVYTFSVTPSFAGVNSPLSSAPSAGEMLFEVTLSP